MKTKRIPFSLEMVEKIQAGEIKGIIKTRDGRKARYLGRVHNNRFPLVFVCALDESGEEATLCNTINGFCSYSGGQSDDDIIIEIEESKQEHQFKPFDKVLVRDSDEDKWTISLYSYADIGRNMYLCLTEFWEQCIPYEGNQELLGTTNNPKEYEDE